MEGVQLGMQANTTYAGSKVAFPNWYGAGHVTCYLRTDHYALCMKNLKVQTISVETCVHE
jgi:hypothetical protein